MTQYLVEWLTAAALTSLGQTKAERRGPRTPAEKRPELVGLARSVAEQLAAEAIQKGISAERLAITSEQLDGGNTADQVATVGINLPFVFKLDPNSPKLAAEALAIRAIKESRDLPASFREAWPTIFAVRTEPPYAYLMEYFPPESGWISLEDRLYPKASTSPAEEMALLRMIARVLDVLFAGWMKSVDRRFLPNIDEDYVGRIASRLEAAQKADDARFKPRPLVVNGRPLKPWTEYLDALERRRERLLAITPRFRTVVHGDPNPGNLLLRLTAAETEVRLIDPKEWHWGDYLFDVAKLTHFLEGTGPIEKPANGRAIRPSWRERDDGAEIEYTLVRPGWTERAVAMCIDRVREFATENHDPAWKERYRLAMASNLLGLPAGRLTHKKNPRPDAALVLYGEGLLHLDAVCRDLEVV